MGSFGMWELLIVLVIVIMIFGTKRLKSLGSDLGGAVKGFRKSLQENTPEETESAPSVQSENNDDISKAP